MVLPEKHTHTGIDHQNIQAVPADGVGSTQGHERRGAGPAGHAGAGSVPGPRGGRAADIHAAEGEHHAAERAPGRTGRAGGRAPTGGTGCSDGLGESGAESKEGAERAALGQSAPGEQERADRRMGVCLCAHVSGWTRVSGFSSLIAPLPCVLIKVSCDKMNATNIFAGDKVREKKNLTCLCLKTITGSWVDMGEDAGGQRRAGAARKEARSPVQHRMGARSPLRALSRDAGMQGCRDAGMLGWSQLVPAPSPSHLQPQQHQLLPVTQ